MLWLATINQNTYFTMRQQTPNSATNLRIENPSTLTEQVYGTLRDEIVAGVLRPGDRLVRRTLSKRLGVSPMPVVEALLRLEADGLVESSPQRGSRVRPLTFEEVHNDQVLREAIECQAARMCAENASKDELATLMSKARLVDRMLPKLRERAMPVAATPAEFPIDVDFHMDVARCGGCGGLVEELGRVWFRRVMRFSWLKLMQYKPRMADCHQQLVEAISSRDLDLAEARMREHVRYSNDMDREALDHFLEQGLMSSEEE